MMRAEGDFIDRKTIREENFAELQTRLQKEIHKEVLSALGHFVAIHATRKAYWDRINENKDPDNYPQPLRVDQEIWNAYNRLVRMREKQLIVALDAENIDVQVFIVQGTTVACTRTYVAAEPVWTVAVVEPEVVKHAILIEGV